MSHLHTNNIALKNYSSNNYCYSLNKYPYLDPKSRNPDRNSSKHCSKRRCRLHNLYSWLKSDRNLSKGQSNINICQKQCLYMLLEGKYFSNYH